MKKRILAGFMLGFVLLSCTACRNEEAAENTTEAGSSETGAAEMSSEILTTAVPENTEAPEPEFQGATRKEMEDAIVAVTFAYYIKTAKLQYDGASLESVFGIYYGGRSRIDEHGTPELATQERTEYSVCADFCYKVYEEAFGYRMFGAAEHTDATTKAMWLMCQKQQDSIRGNVESEDILLARWINPDTYKTFTSEDTKFGLHSVDGVDMDFVSFRKYMEDYKNHLRIGDIVVAGYQSEGHAMMYIGNGYMIECTGNPMDTATGTDKTESEGALKIWSFEDFFLNGKRDTMWVSKSNQKMRDWYIVIRPLNLLLDEGEEVQDSDKGNTEYSVIPEKTQTRLTCECLDIERTSSLGYYGTAVSGGNVTYSVKVYNRSKNAWFCQIFKGSRTGVSYENLTVTETVPAGCELVEGSISEGGQYSDGKITWVVNIAAGASTELTYTVKVNTAAGGKIVNDGGFVGAIPSNVLENGVGKGSAQTVSLEYLKNFPKSVELSRDLFAAVNESRKPTSVQKTAERGGYYNILKSDRSKISTKNAVYYDMIVDGFIGGKRTMVDGDYVTLLRTDYLEAGDIIVCINTDTSGAFLSTNSYVYMYRGDGKFYKKTYSGDITEESSANVFKECYVHSLFYCLRPGQV